MKYTLGNKASIFFDATTGLKILAGKIVEPTPTQTSSRKFKSAVEGGFVVKVEDKQSQAPNTSKVEVVTIEELTDNLKKYLADGLDTKAISKKFNLDEITKIADGFGIEPEDGDTKASLIDAIIEEIENVNE